jgi:hypothetical protein
MLISLGSNYMGHHSWQLLRVPSFISCPADRYFFLHSHMKFIFHHHGIVTSLNMGIVSA